MTPLPPILPWIEHAKSLIGLREIPGSEHNPAILQMWRDAKLGGIKDDETPWCAGFIGATLERAGIRSTRSALARSYAAWGQPLLAPVYGCIAVLARPEAGAHAGHVMYVLGQHDGQLLGLGGNQDNAVKVSTFKRARFISYRYPPGWEPPLGYLPVGSPAEYTHGEG